MDKNRSDIQLTAAGDLLISNGDFSISVSDQQHIADSINAWPGWWKEFFLDGVSVSSFSKSSNGFQLLGRKIKVELNSDGYQVDNPIISLTPDGKLSINPNAQR